MPFPLFMKPSYWFADSHSKELMKLRHLYAGYQLEIKELELQYRGCEPTYVSEHESLVIELRYDYIDEVEYEQQDLRLRYKYKLLSEYDYDLALVELSRRIRAFSDSEYDMEVAKIKLKHGKLSELDYELKVLDIKCESGEITKHEKEKQAATIQNLPWVGCVKDYFLPEHGGSGFGIELDWNDQFINMLRANGYTGNDQQVVGAWFHDVTRSEEFER